MVWHVTVAPEARDDLLQITAFISEGSPQAAERVGLQLIATIASLDHLPYRGTPLLTRPQLRRLVHHNIQIIYKVDAATRQVGVVRLWDARQDPRSLKL